MATGFHRNTLTNKEGGVDKEEFRVEAVVDRVNTTGDGLARPDGRLRPVPHAQVRPDLHTEYYQLFAFFNTADGGGPPRPPARRDRRPTRRR